MTKSTLCAAAITAALSFPSLACTVSPDKYDGILIGASYRTTVWYFGCEGEELARSGAGRYATVAYVWYGEGLAGLLGANITMIFQNGRLISKAQFGMKP